MKKQISTLFGVAVAAAIAFSFTADIASAEEAGETKIPSWAQKEIDKVAEAAPTITDEQKGKIFKAIEVRGKAVKTASESGGSEAEIKQQTKDAWSRYMNGMKEILSAEQFEQFDKKRLENEKAKENKTADE